MLAAPTFVIPRLPVPLPLPVRIRWELAFGSSSRELRTDMTEWGSEGAQGFNVGVTE